MLGWGSSEVGALGDTRDEGGTGAAVGTDLYRATVGTSSQELGPELSWKERKFDYMVVTSSQCKGSAWGSQESSLLQEDWFSQARAVSVLHQTPSLALTTLSKVAW